MHIPDGYLGPQTFVAMYGVMIPVWARAASAVRKRLRSGSLPVVALSSAFTFAVMMFNVPVPGGTTVHAVGSTLLAVTIGPWSAVLAITAALVVQATVFANGGITSLGANAFSAAFVGPFVGYYLYRSLVAVAPGRAPLAAGLASFVSLNCTALVAAVLVGVQPLLNVSADGRPLYAPFPLAVTIPAMLTSHLLVGLAEAAVTAGAVSYLARRYAKLPV